MSTALATQTEAPFDPKELAIQIKDLPKVYVDLVTRSHKAIEAGDKLIDKIKENGMDEATAEEVTKHIKRAKNTSSLIKTERTPYTQIFDLIKKAFTQIEADIKDSNERLKKFLDAYATEQARIQKEKEEKARKEAARLQELGDVEAEAEKGLKNSFINLLTQKKTYLNSVLETMTLPIQDDVRHTLQNFDEAIPVKELKWPIINLVYVTEDELKAIKKTVGQKLAGEMKAEYAQEIADTKKELLDKVPSKIAELQEIEKASAAKKKKLQEEAELRRKEEEKRLQKENEDAKLREAEKAKAKSESTAMGVMFSVEQAKSTSAVPKGKMVFEITVTHQQAYAEMFSLWFAKEGGSMELDKLENVTLKRVRAYFEKLAEDGGEKIQSKYIKYNERFETSMRGKI